MDADDEIVPLTPETLMNMAHRCAVELADMRAEEIAAMAREMAADYKEESPDELGLRASVLRKFAQMIETRYLVGPHREDPSR